MSYAGINLEILIEYGCNRTVEVTYVGFGIIKNMDN